MKYQEVQRSLKLVLSQGWDRCQEGGHAYVYSVSVTMVAEGLNVVDGHGDVHHTGEQALLATSVHKKCAVVDHVYVQLVEFLMNHQENLW